MATNLSFDSVPPYYREVNTLLNSLVSNTCSKKDLLKQLLAQSKLPNTVLHNIWGLLNLCQEDATPHHVYSALALTGWAQHGKQPTSALLTSFVGGLPTVDLGNLSEFCPDNSARLSLRYSDLVSIDTISVDIVPEKKGLFLKHVEYQVTSKRFGSTVSRRYNDFVALHELLLNRFPYRLIPKLPPKRMVGADSQFIEDRRKALRRWLTLVARHPVLSDDSMLHYFLTQPVEDLQYKIREVFRRIPDEFMTSELAARAKDLVPSDTHSEFATSREQIRVILNGVSRIKQIADVFALRSHGYAADMADLGAQLTYLAAEPGENSTWATGGNTAWSDMKKGFALISKDFTMLSNKASQLATREEEEVCERLNCLLDLLNGHKELCERIERGVAHDHQKALSRMLALKKRQIQGVLRGSDAESVETLEQRMLTQESVIASVELRAAFSLHCIHLETQLVHTYLEILASVLHTLVAVQMRGHSELADIWKLIHPTVLKSLPDKNFTM